MEPTEAALAQVKSLMSAIPGGQYLEDHWQEGPYWLVAVAPDPQSPPAWPVRALLGASPVILERVLAFDGFDVTVGKLYLVSTYTHETIGWNEAEDQSVNPIGEPAGPLQSTTPDVIVAALLKTLGLEGEVARYLGLEAEVNLQRALQAVDPQALLPAISAMCPEPVESDNPLEDVVALLHAAVGAVSVPQT